MRGHVALAPVYFGLLMAANYLMRPVRDTLGVQAGTDQLSWLIIASIATLAGIIPLIGLGSARFGFRKTVLGANALFALVPLVFFVISDADSVPFSGFTAYAFFIWQGVFNILAVSLFWSFIMRGRTEVWRLGNAGRIAAGGSMGALCGPLVSHVLAIWKAPEWSLLIAGGLLILAFFLLLCEAGRQPNTSDMPDQENRLSNSNTGKLTIAILLYSIVTTVLYMLQARIVSETIDNPQEQLNYFTNIDFAGNVLAAGLQFFITPRLLRHAGARVVMLMVPLVLLVGLGWLIIASGLSTIAVLMIAVRATNGSFNRPAREILFSNRTTVRMHRRFQTKQWVDTVVYRLGDGLGACVFAITDPLLAFPWQVAGLAGVCTLWTITVFNIRSTPTKSNKREPLDQVDVHPSTPIEQVLT